MSSNSQYLKMHSDYFKAIMPEIERYSRPQCEQGERASIEKIISDREEHIKMLYSYEMAEMLKILDKSTHLYQILVGQIIRNLEEILFCDLQYNNKKGLPCEDVFDIKKNLEKFGEIKDKIGTLFRSNVDKIIEKLYDYVAYKAYMDWFHMASESEKSTALIILKTMIIELCDKEINGEEKHEEQKIKFEDIKKVGEGVYSSVYAIGDKVIKIGRARRTWIIPDNPYIVRPIIREKINVGKDTNIEEMYIEVMDKIDTITEIHDLEAFEAELYNLYANLRKMGIIWDDIRYQNVGRLKKTQESSYVSNEFLSIRDNENYTNKKQLPPGTLVILDADCLYLEEEYNKSHSSSSFGRSFDIKYKKESMERQGKNY